MINLTDEEINESRGLNKPKEYISMKCHSCSYEEEVPEWILEEFLNEDDGYNCQYLECNKTMIRKNSIFQHFFGYSF
jgi:hypothetical protein